MKIIFIAVCGLLFLGADASSYLTSDSAFQLKPECAKGPVHWCQNLVTAKSCGAVTHCIQTVWEKQKYPEDHDSICQICLDMVKQARDQLRSNETQQDLKAVFEGTCEFIRIKKIRQECDKLADDMVPELVEALSSQMNPQVVCSVSGLCNSAAIDKELAKHANELVVNKKSSGLTCNQCNKISSIISTKFANTNRDQVLENMLSVCGQMSSLSDGCSAIVLSYFNEVYDHLKDNLNTENICHMAGVCVAQFHQHEEDDIEVIEDSRIGFIDHVSDDVPCDLCKQLIVHLRDLLVANTTEAEFKNVLEGICKQTKSFKSECLSLADQYYDLIYAKLTKELDPDGACFMIGICPKGKLTQEPQHSYEVMPLIPNDQLLVKKKILGENEPVLSAQEIQSFQLPKDVLLLNAEQLEGHVVQKKNNQFCTACEYFLHFVQDALASPVNEENIKQSVMNMCHKVKSNLQSECEQFVNMYADAIISLLIQEIDPSIVCPRLLTCAQTTLTANEKCPLCLFLIQDIEEQLQHNKSKQNIEDKLHALCNRLSDNLKTECDDFINTYTAELVDKLANDFTPQQICLYLKCCSQREEILIENIGDRASYNDYFSNTVYQIEPEQVSAPECLLCEELVKSVEKKIAKQKSRDHIKKVLEQACTTLPKTKLKNKCLAAIEKDSDFIIDLFLKEVTPKEVCLAMGFCIVHYDNSYDIVQLVPLVDEKPKPKPNKYVCRVCQLIVKEVEERLNNKTAQHDIENCVKHVCDALPSAVQPDCKKLIDAYADEIIKHFPSESPEKLCSKACFCEANESDEDSSENIDDEFSSPECVLCEQLVKEVEKKVKNDKSREHIKEVLEQACSSFHKKELKEKCIEVVDKNADYIVNAIMKEVTPKEICHGLAFCETKTTNIDAKIEKVSDQLMEKYSETPQCVLCQLIATKLEADLKNKKTEEEIENAVRRACHALPNKYAVKCNKFIQDYADLIISMVSTVPPKELCGELNLCLSHLNKDTSQRDVLECGICNTAVDGLAIVLEKNGPKEKKIVTETTCHLLPAKYYQQCNDFMNIYGISVSTLIKKSVKRSEICVKIGKCFQNGDNSMFVEINGGTSNSDVSDESDDADESIESHELYKRNVVTASIDNEIQIEWLDDEGRDAEYGDFFEGDLILTDDQKAAIMGERNAVINEDFRWPSAIIPYELSNNYSAEHKAVIFNAMKQIANVSCVKFRQRTNETDYVQFEASKNGCSSNVGRIGGKQVINLQISEPGIGCFKEGSIIHQILHALGFYHMQSTFDRDNYIRINVDNIKKNRTQNFKKYASSHVTNFNTSYDFGSIMHYHCKAFAINRNIPTIVPLDGNEDSMFKMGQREGLSKKDILKLNAMYRCKSSINNSVTTLHSDIHMIFIAVLTTFMLKHVDFDWEILTFN